MLKPCKRGQSITLEWSDTADQAYTNATKAIGEATSLCFPTPDAITGICTDASETQKPARQSWWAMERGAVASGREMLPSQEIHIRR
ncbi:hypothetical protein Pmani_011564 [Petrolisthes manimaculis]|uniref:Uncharacterized protein n=1 Tax=Petrolisthes manimaculis TaxID=1843537 RepID=A0AAE1UBG3_9EUCA|nr:hypothetical protein Pmani_011564 [Petrolisthes manimaculis]